jgi:hypothetical protein
VCICGIDIAPGNAPSGADQYSERVRPGPLRPFFGGLLTVVAGTEQDNFVIDTVVSVAGVGHKLVGAHQADDRLSLPF